MKAKSSLLAAVCLVAVLPGLLAADPSPQTSDNKVTAKSEPAKVSTQKKSNDSEKKTVMLTGSNLPQTVTKVGRITDSAEPVSVISHDELEKSGEINLASALRKTVPGIH